MKNNTMLPNRTKSFLGRCPYCGERITPPGRIVPEWVTTCPTCGAVATISETTTGEAAAIWADVTRYHGIITPQDARPGIDDNRPPYCITELI